MKKLIPLILFVLIAIGGNAQRFKGGIAVGFNMTQLDGDLLSGYNKLGLNGGFWVNYPFNDKWSGGLELLYTQKGASRSINEENIASTRTFDRFSINYIEVPLYAAYTYKKFTFQAGLTGAYLMGAQVKDFTGTRDYKNNLRSFESGTMWGVSYLINKQYSVQLRWQYSVASIAAGDKQYVFTDNAFSQRIIGLYNNLFSFAMHYTFKQ